MGYKIISVTYGHGTPNGNGKFTASGKLYDYGTDKEYRTGDTVVVPVQHAVSGKLYNTLAVVRQTHNLESEAGQRVAENLTNPEKGYKAKDVSDRFAVAVQNGQRVQSDRDVNITTLPGYDTRKSNAKWSVGEGVNKGGSSSRVIMRTGGES